MLKKLLPTTGTWFIDGTFEEAVQLRHPVSTLTRTLAPNPRPEPSPSSSLPLTLARSTS